MAHFHVLTNLYPPETVGGYELLAQDVVERLRKKGHRVTVITTGERHRTDVDIKRILRLARPFGQTPHRDRLRHAAAAAFNRLALSRYLKGRALPDAVLVMSQRRLGLEALRVYQERGVSTVFTVNDDWPVAYVPQKRARGWKERVIELFDEGRLARHTWHGVAASRVVYLSNAIRKIVRGARAPLPAGVVCPQGVDLSAFPRRVFRGISESPRLLFVGRLHPAKAPDVAIATLVEMRLRGIDASLTLAGAPVDAGYQAALEEQVAAAGVVKHVTFLGPVPRHELPRVYRRADIFLFPLRWKEEAQGLTYIEAMASGIPVVAYPTSGALEVLRPGFDEDAEAPPAWSPEESLSGDDVVVLSERCDGAAFAEACLALMSDTERQRALGARARRWLGEHASLERYVRVLEAELLGKAHDNEGVVLLDADHAADVVDDDVAPSSETVPLVVPEVASPSERLAR